MWLTFFYFFTILSYIRHKSQQFVIKPKINLIIVKDAEEFDNRSCIEPCGSTLLVKQYVGTNVHNPNEKRLFFDEEDDTYEEEDEFGEYLKEVYEEIAKLKNQIDKENTESKDVTENTEPNFVDKIIEDQDNEKDDKLNNEPTNTKLLNDKNRKSKEEDENTKKEILGVISYNDKEIEQKVLDCKCEIYISLLVFFSHRNKETFEQAIFLRRRNEFKPFEVEGQK